MFRRSLLGLGFLGALVLPVVGQGGTKTPTHDCFQAPSGDPESVILRCTPVINGRPSKVLYERALNRRGLAYSRLNRKVEALRDFDALIAGNKTSAGYFDNRREVLGALGQFDKALADANEAIRLSPTLAYVYHGRGDIYFEMSRFDLAITDYTTAYSKREPFISSIMNRGRAYAKLRLFDRAVQDFTRVLEDDPGISYALRERAFAYIELGLPQKAEADLVVFLQREPSDPDARRALSQLQILPPSAYKSLDRRVALVIGNSDYQFANKLANPTNDATDMSASLRQLGFDVIEGKNLDRHRMDDAIRQFGIKLDRADLALFFYAGHALQVGGKNYLVPIDAKLERPGDLALDTVEIATILGQMEAERRVNLVFLDACRDNPLARSLARSLGSRSVAIGRGLASIQSAIGTMIAYATQPDNVALDGQGRNSPFTTSLIRHIGDPGVDIGTIMRRVRAEVIAATNEKQVPWEHSSLVGEIILAR
jgi:tetratricopeptide (TPR) repeat protein